MKKAGRVAIVPKGDFVFGTQYTRLDMVKYQDGVYVAKKDNTSVYPTIGDDDDNWMYMVGEVEVGIATIKEAGKVKPDGKTITVTDDGTITGASTDFTGTKAEYEAAVSKSEIPDGTIVNITDDYSGGSEGTKDYNDLENKPQINNVELEGNVSLSDIGAVPQNQINGYKIYTAVSQLGFDDINKIDSLAEIIEAMSYGSMLFLLSSNDLYAKELVPTQYGCLQILKVNGNRIYLTWYNSASGVAGLKEWKAQYREGADLTDWIYTQDTTNVAYVAGDVINTEYVDCLGYIENTHTILTFTLPLSRPVQGNIKGEDIKFSTFALRKHDSVFMYDTTPDKNPNITYQGIIKTAAGIRIQLNNPSKWDGDNISTFVVTIRATITVT